VNNDLNIVYKQLEEKKNIKNEYQNNTPNNNSYNSKNNSSKIEIEQYSIDISSNINSLFEKTNNEFRMKKNLNNIVDNNDNKKKNDNKNKNESLTDEEIIRSLRRKKGTLKKLHKS
jgi:hypothetical protein